jgi:hypothetical protein
MFKKNCRKNQKLITANRQIPNFEFMPSKLLTGIFFFLPILFLSSCIYDFLPRQDNLWFYTYSSGEMPPGFTLTPANFLYVAPGKNFTMDFGEFQNGKWERKGDTLFLYPDAGDARHYLMKYTQINEMQLSIAPSVVSDFSGSPSSFASPAENPFSLINNQWRIPAKHKEISSVIRQRLINHCAFWKAYFLWALNDNLDNVDVRSTPTPIKIYGNGFALKEFDDLPKQWKNYFYDSADCRLANSMIETIFQNQNIAWAHTDNKYKMFMGAFEQLENFLKEEDKKLQ